jgi:hypothetical protein
MVSRLRQMNELTENIDPNRRRLRSFIRECQKSMEHAYIDRDVAWTMLW